jgi:hypothetical protein
MRSGRSDERGSVKVIQDDHAFCDPELGPSVRDAWAAEDAALLLGLSDHAPLILDFQVDSIAMRNLVDESESDASTES